MLLPIPFSLVGLIFMGFGGLLWSWILIDFIGWTWKARKGEDIGSTYDFKKKDFVPNTLRRRLGGYFGSLLLGIGFFVFGYLLFTDLIWNVGHSLFSTQNFGYILAFCVVFLVVSYLLHIRKSSGPNEEDTFTPEEEPSS